jgi:hypothetical protein
MACPVPGTISPMSGFWAFFWLAVILKIPIVALLLIVWWAIREPPVPEAGDDRGGSDRDPRHPRRRPPHPPRRGPHRDPAPGTPARVRLARARRRAPSTHA